MPRRKLGRVPVLTEGFMLQSEPHESLFRRLLDIDARVRAALERRDAEAVRELSKEHRDVMNSLGLAGLSKDPRLLDLAKEVKNQVSETIKEIEKRRHEIGRKLAVVAERKKVAYVYAKNALK